MKEPNSLVQYCRSGRISLQQRLAGLRYYEDGLRALGAARNRGLAKRPSIEGDYSGAAAEAERFTRANRALGPLKDVAICVIVDGQTVSEYCEAIGEPVDHGMPLLRLALTTLVKFYDIQVADEAAMRRLLGT